MPPGGFVLEKYLFKSFVLFAESPPNCLPINIGKTYRANPPEWNLCQSDGNYLAHLRIPSMCDCEQRTVLRGLSRSSTSAYAAAALECGARARVCAFRAQNALHLCLLVIMIISKMHSVFVLCCVHSSRNIFDY